MNQFQQTASRFLDFYIIDRRNGVSYNPYGVIGYRLVVSSNRAVDSKPFYINPYRLTIGLKERRYRLIPKGEQ